MFNIGIPFAGNFFASLENKIILKNIMKGGFVDYDLPDDYLNLLCSSVKKKHYVLSFQKCFYPTLKVGQMLKKIIIEL